MTRNRTIITALAFAVLASPAFAASPFSKTLPRGLAPFEKPVTINSQRAPSVAPVGPITSLGEWEEAESVMTLWTNPSWIKALSENGSITLISDDQSAAKEWTSWLSRNQISDKNINYLIAPTDSIWVRDYGPWWILDGQNQFGIVDTTYNRPRPHDDKVPGYVARALHIPLFTPELIHTGGNYYSDGFGNAFSSTLVFKENHGLSMQEVLNRMLSFLGIQRYTTSSLGAGATIEHMDTFGKLVAPDTWVFSQFDSSSKFKADSDHMVETLSTMKSAYGTPYKIFRMPMVRRSGYGEDYRAYINSFVSNGVLYFPTYGNDANDKRAAEIYQQALPGYKIVGVDNDNTEWGDSVHCRSRNLLKRNTIFIFPKFETENGQTSIVAKVVASPGSKLVQAPLVHLEINGQIQTVSMDSRSTDIFATNINVKSGDVVKFFVTAEDTNGITKISPMKAPAQMIEWKVQ